MAMNRRELIENASFVHAPRVVLVEDAARAGKLIVRGEFGRSGVPTANRRIYPRRLWEREFDRLREAIANRSLTGELNHPRDGQANMFNTAHLITGLTVNPDGVVIGEAEVLEDTPGGAIVASIYKRGGKVGVSSRGFGSTEVNEDGADVVQEDYQLVTFDFVSDPADKFAYPEQVNEGSGKFFSFPSSGGGGPMTEQSQTSNEGLLKEAAEIRESAERGVYERLVKDPGSLPKPIQESLRAFFGGGDTGPKLLKENGLLKSELTEVRGKLKKAEADVVEAVTRGREAAYRYFIEKSLAGDPDAEQIREAVGKVLQYESVQALRSKIEETRKAILDRRAIQEQAELRIRQEMEALQQEREAQTQQRLKLEATLEKSLQLNRELVVRQYAVESGRQAPPQARRVLESTNPRSFDEVDQLLEGFRPVQNTPDSAATARSRAREWVGSGTRSNSSIDEERSTVPQNGDRAEALPGLGASWNELRTLSGVGIN